jgi:hypothetical protein
LAKFCFILSYARLTEHLAGETGALAGDDMLQGALCDHRLDAVLDDPREAVAGLRLVTPGRGVEQRRVLHLPLDVEVDDEATAIIGEEVLPGVGLGEEAVIELGHLVPGPFVMQSRAVVGADDGAELLADRVLRLAHGEHRQADEDQQRDKDPIEGHVAGTHQRSPRPRASTVT